MDGRQKRRCIKQITNKTSSIITSFQENSNREDTTKDKTKENSLSQFNSLTVNRFTRHGSSTRTTHCKERENKKEKVKDVDKSNIK